MISTLWLFSWSLSLLFFSPILSYSVTVDSTLLSLLNATSLPRSHPELRVMLSRQLVGAGFHRTLLTQVEQVTSQHSIISDSSVLHVAIVENITCDTYVDIDQVAFLAEFGGPDLVSSSYMDTEKPASVSPNHVVMTFTSVGGKVELPLHFRYQPPSHSPYKTITVPSPMAFISTNQLSKELQQNSIRLPCNGSSSPDNLCLWTRVQLYSKIGDGDELNLTADIPQGLEEHKSVVVRLTVLATLMATVFIAYNFVKIRYRIENEKKNQ